MSFIVYNELPTMEEVREVMTYYPLHGVCINKKTNKVIGGNGTTKYLSFTVGGKKYQLARLIYVYMEGSVPDGYDIDHFNHTTVDNTWDNLNLLTIRENVLKCLPTFIQDKPWTPKPYRYYKLRHER